jgi:hypothetical protein
MSILGLPSVVALAAILTAGSSHSSSTMDGVAGSCQPSPYEATATIQDLMDSEIDPAADFIWASVGTVITKSGRQDRRPHTEAQWVELRRRAITLVEATNLLVMPGRRIAIRKFPSAGPGVLSSDEIERKLNVDRPSFNAFALALREVGLKVLAAVDKRDVAALSENGEALDEACEACHVENWYPHEVIPELPDFKSGRESVRP